MSAGHKEIESPVGKVGSGAQALPKQAKRSAGRDPNRLEPQRDTVSDDNCSVAATSSYLLTRWWRLLSSGHPSHPLPAEASPPLCLRRPPLHVFASLHRTCVRPLRSPAVYQWKQADLQPLQPAPILNAGTQRFPARVYMWNGAQAAMCDVLGAICGTMGTQAEGGFSWKRCPCRTKTTLKP